MNDVDIFAACLKDMLLENDVVTVPGLGSFITRLMPASFSDLGRTINPPYRKLSFRAAELADPSLFTGHLSTLLPEGQDVDSWLQSFVAGFKEALDRTKRVELSGLGALRATAQNDYFFVASDDLDIYPEGMGLEPVTIKSSTLMDYGLELKDDSEQGSEESAPESVAESETEVEADAETEPVVEFVTEPAAEQQVAIELESEQAMTDEPEPAESSASTEEPSLTGTPAPAASPAPAATPVPDQKPRRRVRWWVVVLILLAVILLLLILSVIFKDVLPWGGAVDNFINHILYSEEELRLLNS